MDKILKTNPGTTSYFELGGNETKLFTIMLDYISNLPIEATPENNESFKEAINYCTSYLAFRMRNKATGNLLAKDIVDKVISNDDSSAMIIAALEECVNDHSLECLSRKGLIEVDLFQNTVSLTKLGEELCEELGEE